MRALVKLDALDNFKVVMAAVEGRGVSEANLDQYIEKPLQEMLDADWTIDQITSYWDTYMILILRAPQSGGAA